MRYTRIARNLQKVLIKAETGSKYLMTSLWNLEKKEAYSAQSILLWRQNQRLFFVKKIKRDLTIDLWIFFLFFVIGPTGITGLYQHPNPRPALIAVYNATLKELESIPATSVYRQSVENITKARKKIVEESEVTEVIENKIGAGLIEEVLIQASEEFNLIKKMAEWKPWEELEEKPLDDQWVYFDTKE